MIKSPLELKGFSEAKKTIELSRQEAAYIYSVAAKRAAWSEKDSVAQIWVDVILEELFLAGFELKRTEPGRGD